MPGQARALRAAAQGHQVAQEQDDAGAIQSDTWQASQVRVCVQTCHKRQMLAARAQQ